MSWHDKHYIEKFMCKNQELEFDLVRTFDALGTVPYQEKLSYKFKC